MGFLRSWYLVMLPGMATAAWGQGTLPAGTPFPVKLLENHPMRVGETLRAEMLYPVYDRNRLVLPAGSVVTGSVAALTPDRTRRIHARLRADFTPFHVPVVRFDQVALPDGTTARLMTGTATDGAPVYRLVPPSPQTGGFFKRQYDVLKQGAADRLAVVTGPEKADRFKQFAYSQLPYHPERISKGTAWSLELREPLPLAASNAVPPTASPAPKPTDTANNSEAAPPTWLLQAYLTEAMTSATSRPGQAVHAVVAEPILNPDGSVAVPQGSVLTGAVTQAKPARTWGRAGELRFSFRELTLPGAEPQPVQVALAGADNGADMEMNSEGEVKPKPKDKIAVPLLLAALAARPLDSDGGVTHHRLGKDALASNSLGTIGFIVGTAAQKPYLAAGIGYYGAAISIYERIFRRGKEVTFARDTRIVLQTTARRTAAIKPEASSLPGEPPLPRP